MEQTSKDIAYWPVTARFVKGLLFPTTKFGYTCLAAISQFYFSDFSKYNRKCNIGDINKTFISVEDACRGMVKTTLLGLVLF